MKNILIAIVIVIVAGGAGYFIGQSGNTSAADAKKMQDSITMMKEQSATIKKMGEIMKNNAAVMQQAGTKYNDQDLMMSGKDMETLAAKYTKDNESQASGGGSMKELMTK